MKKRDELTNPDSCMSRARDDELTFVLLGRDIAAPAAIRAWVARRISLGKNTLNDPQITEALECATAMEADRRDPPLSVTLRKSEVDFITRLLRSQPSRISRDFSQEDFEEALLKKLS